MKTINQPPATSNLRLFLVLPLFILALATLSINASGQESSTAKKEVAPPSPPPPPPPPPPQADLKAEIYDEVDVAPSFPGGNPALIKYIVDNIRYPDVAKEKGISGKVIVRFCVTEKGGVNRISVLRGVAPLLDAEAIRMVGTLPAFKPGIKDGKNVPVWHILPVEFKLE